MSDSTLTSEALHEANKKGDEPEDICVKEIKAGVEEQDGEENNKRDDDDDDGQEGLDLDLVEEEVDEEEDVMSCQDEQEGDREPMVSNGIESIVEEKVESACQESVAPSEEEVAQNPENVIVTGTSAEDLKGLLSRPRHGSEIFIGGISKDTNEEDLRELCASCGEIFEVRLLKDQKGENKGYAFVTFMDKESADKAIESMTNSELKGRKLRLSRSQLKHKLFIGNVPKTWEKEDLEKALAEVGPGTENIELLMEPHNPGKNRGFAFVEYYNHGCAEHARKAMSMPGFQLGTSAPTISWAECPTVDDATMSQVKGIYIRNLPENVSQEQLKQLFEHHGEVTKVILPGSKLGQPKRDFGFVHFADRESALKAIEKTEKYEIEGRELEVSLARPPTDKRFGDPYKKAWRANISSKEVDDFFEKSGREERTGGSLASLSNDSLFFLDKSKDTVTEKKTRRHQEKILHCDSILQRQSLVPALPEPRKRKAKHGKRGSKILSKRINSSLTSKNVGHVENFRDIWSSEDETCTEGRKKLKKCTPMAAPAVEVDAPGCSYNPSKEDHQDALALAVAEEMQKAYKKELEPTPAPHFVDGMPIEEEERYFIEADNGDDGEEEEGEAEGLDLSKGQRLKKKLTRAERNRKARRRAELKLEGTKKQRASIQKDVARVDEILDDIKIDEEHKKKRWLRRTTAKKEKCAQAPPKLGKHKFQPEPVQVLLTEEVTGSLRKLKGCYSLSRERFKSLQRRGIIEPRIPLKRRSRRKRITYVEGTKGHLEREMHAAAEARRAARKLPKPVLNDEMMSLISAAGS